MVIFFGAMVGGIVGLLAGFAWSGFGLITVGVIGAVLGAIIGGIIGNKKDVSLDQSYKTLKLREEVLDITKKQVPTGSVKVHKEIIEDEQIITVPVRREEMVIEKIEIHDGIKEEPEIIRIPLMEERVEVVKHPVHIAEVSVSKQQVMNMEEIKETLKKEEVHLEVIGHPDVRNEESLQKEY